MKATRNYSLNRETSSKTFFQKIIISETFVGERAPPPLSVCTSLDHIKIHGGAPHRVLCPSPIPAPSSFKYTHRHLRKDATESSQIIKSIPVGLQRSPQAI